ncbi:hypothetical protein GTY81_19555 [Streptomyces sp. SID8366]|uniref:hypothetical protein n=1 Tax=unclassified Streptomyces TaxID=2593676 RepID=UPI000DB9B760|nr:hypothetical protein [Streptomyces sp. PsTaAH-130]MYU06039.1 hypothetical protein [Streptomyces sp. SID8366]MYU67470.1 hypothetical protein [Streptomyces sp. SID69]RAJ64103.1 hypothetical protein K376_01199 [Streptomyces sp. PsTaAH-130]
MHFSLRSTHFSLRLPPHAAARRNSPRELLVSAGGLLLLGSLPTALGSTLSGFSVFGGMIWPHPVLTLVDTVNIATTALQLVWLTRLLTARRQEFRPAHRVFVILAVSVLSTLTAWGLLQHPAGPSLHEYPARTVLLAWLCYELYRWHGIPLSAPAAAGSRAARWDDTWQMTQTVFSYCGIGGFSAFLTVLTLQSFGPQWLPVMRTSQLTAIGGFSASQVLLFGLAWTVVLEGSVIGTTAILLRAARRPSWQIYAIVAIVEIIFHAYFGVPALCMAVYAVLCTHFYLTRRQVIPLLAGHALFDFAGLLVSSLSILEKLICGIVFALIVTTVECWLAVEAGRRAKFFMAPRLFHLTVSFRPVPPPAETPATDRSTTSSEIS